jgi:hypothetical protein
VRREFERYLDFLPALPRLRRHEVRCVRRAASLSSHAKWRPSIVPKPAPDAPDANQDGAGDSDATPRCASRYRPWAELLRRTFGIDVETCHDCGQSGFVVYYYETSNGTVGDVTDLSNGQNVGSFVQGPRQAPTPARAPVRRRCAFRGRRGSRCPTRPCSPECHRWCGRSHGIVPNRPRPPPIAHLRARPGTERGQAPVRIERVCAPSYPCSRLRIPPSPPRSAHERLADPR